MQHGSSAEIARARTREPGVLWQWIRTSALAWRDIVHEWQVALCLILALAAVLTPLLVLFGLKSGIITTMTERLKADPRNLEVVLKGNNRLEPPWIEQVHSRPDVGFLVPRTRSLAATVSLIGSQGRSLSYVDMIPTANGDPILLPEMQAPAGLNEAILSHTVAVKLDVSEGGQVEGIVRRRLDGRPQAVEISLQIIGVLPEAAFGSDAVFVSLPLLVATEDYRDGHRIPELEVGEGRPPREGERSFAGVRLYARSLDDVAGVAAFLRAEGFDVATKAKDIETVKAIDRVLSFIFLVIAGVGVTGFLLSLSASLWANVDRKRRDLAMLRLVGLRTGPLLAFPAAQAFIVAIGGLALSAVLYFGISSLFNAALAADLQRDEFVCRLFIGDGLVAGLLTIIFALIASAVGGYRALKIDPAESLREL